MSRPVQGARGRAFQISPVIIGEPHVMHIAKVLTSTRTTRRGFGLGAFPVTGPGDTIESAAYRCQTKYGVDADIVLQGWRREINDMKASRLLRLFHAYWAAGLARAEHLYREERSQHEDAEIFARLADFVAGETIQKEGAEE